jgi:hypothetical protein
MAMATIVEKRAVTGGVDTHLDVNVAAALDQIGGLLGVESSPTTRAGCQSLLSWLVARESGAGRDRGHWLVWRRSGPTPASGRGEGG